MAATSLKRKARKNHVVSKKRTDFIKLHSIKPSLKNIDIEAIKLEFAKAKEAKQEKPAAKKKAKAEEATETVAE